MQLQAQFWYQEGRFKEAKSEALRAVDTYEKVGYTEGLEVCRDGLQQIEARIEEPSTSRESDFNGEAL